MINPLEIRYNDLKQAADYREYLRKHPRLIFLFFELTDKCNMSCLHCGSNCKSGNHTFLPKKYIFKVLDEVAACYNPDKIMVCLTGGEPMLHPDFYEIAEYIRNKGFPWGMTTNGTLIDEKAAAKLVQVHLGSVSVSLDGLEEAHDFLRNKKGAFKMAVSGIKNLLACREYKGILQVTTVVYKQNLEKLDLIYELLCQLGVRNWRLTNIDPIGRTLQNQELLLEYEKFVQMISYIKEKRFDPAVTMEVAYGCSHYLTPEWEHMTRDNYFLCGAGINVAGILCNGDICSCFDIERRPELVQGSVYKDNFVDVWENRFQIYRKDRTEECKMCRECSHRFVCGGDSYHTWDFEKHMPKICLKQRHFIY